MAIKISKIKEQDLERAKLFCLGIFEELSWPKEFAYGFDNLKEFFGGKREVFFVAKLQERIVACGGVKELSKTQALMKRFYVAKEFRGKSLASSMLEKIKKFAREKKYKTIVLEVFPDNLRAIRFYQKKGFSAFKPKPRANWTESQHPKTFEFRKLEL